jgi:Papain family cysteine protease/Kelch motif
MTTRSTRLSFVCWLAAIAVTLFSACTPPGASAVGESTTTTGGATGAGGGPGTGGATGTGGSPGTGGATGTGGGPGTGGASNQGYCFDLHGKTVCVQSTDPGGVPDGGATAVPPPPGGTPTSASLNMTGFAVADQGTCGSCAAFATKDAMGQRSITQQGSYTDFSAADIWHIAGYGAADCLPGSVISTIFGAISAEPTYVVNSTTWPYDPSMPATSLDDVPPAATLSQAGVATIAQAVAINPGSLDDMKNSIANGWPPVIGVRFYQSSGWLNPSGAIGLPAPGDPGNGGHAIMLTSYDDAVQTFGFVNSWGTGFGQQGYGTLTYAYLAQYSTGGVALQSLGFKGSKCSADYCSTNGLQPGSYCDGTTAVQCEMVGGCIQVLNQTTCTSACSGGQCTGPTCGNGMINPGEQCDGANLGGATCESQGFSGGSLSCTSTCTFDTAGCCNNACSQQGATQCANASTVETCSEGPLGCLAWGADASCPNGCDAATGACAADPCGQTPQIVWTAMAPLAQPDPTHVAVALNGDIHVFGWTSYLMHRVFTPSTNTWAQKNNAPLSVADGAAVVVNGGLYAFNDGTFGSGNAMQWNASTDTWTVLAADPWPRRYPPAGVINGEVYLAGGFGTNGNVTTAYDPVTNSWQDVAPIPFSGVNTAVTYSGQLYVIGVSGGNSNPTQIASYSPSTNAWTPLTSLSASCYSSEATLVGSSIWVLGGTSNGTAQGSINIYQIPSDTWCPGPALPEPMYGFALAQVNGKIYIIGGYQGTPAETSSNVWEGTIQ